MVYASTDKIYVDDLKEYCIAKVCNTRVEPILSSKIPENYRCVTYVEMVGELCKKLV
jgi:hypothetical protein